MHRLHRTRPRRRAHRCARRDEPPGRVEWTEHARATLSLEREGELLALVTRPAASVAELVAAFLRPPLHQDGYARRMGTLYTVAYDVRRGTCHVPWPELAWEQGFESFDAGVRTVVVESPAAA